MLLAYSGTARCTSNEIMHHVCYNTLLHYVIPYYVERDWECSSNILNNMQTLFLITRPMNAGYGYWI